MLTRLIPWLQFLQYVVVAIGIVVSGIWVYWLVVTRREAEPASELEINVDFVGRQKGQWLIEVTAVITNKSLVRYEYHDFQAMVRYLLPHDRIKDGPERINYQLVCPHTINDRIGGKKRYFAYAVHINPRLSFRHSYITFIPAEATFIWVLCKMKFPTRHQWLRWRKQTEDKNGQRLFRVPTAEGA